jgi:ABC-type branched-chain amino acid transport systems, periplasmic component
MTNPDGARHDPKTDSVLHFTCEQWARKLAASRVELFSTAESTAFELHKQTCSRCQELALHYQEVDAYLYSFLCDEYISLPTRLPSLPWWRRARYLLSTFWSLLQRSFPILWPIVTLLLQASGVVLLTLLFLLIFLQRYVQISMQFPISDLALFVIAMSCILPVQYLQTDRKGRANRMPPLAATRTGYSTIETPNRSSDFTDFTSGQQGQRVSVKRSTSSGTQIPLRVVRRRWSPSGRLSSNTAFVWDEDSAASLPFEPETPVSPAVPVRQINYLLRTLREQWIAGVTLCLLLAIGMASLGWFPVVVRPTPKALSGIPPTGAPIGISIDGSKVFDTNRADGDLKRQAASLVAANDLAGAQKLWRQALLIDSSDAETLIYQENQRVLASGHPSFTLVVGAIFAQPHIGGARDILQGAYVAQKDYNDQMIKQPHSPLLRLMIASSDVDTFSPQSIAQEVVQAAQKDRSIVGIIGWPTSASTESVLPIFNAAQLPMISATASANELSGASPYFFRVAPTDAQQALVAARYVTETLHSQRIALFMDPNDDYSNSLAHAFLSSLQHAHTDVTTTTYTYVKGDPSTIDVQMEHVLQGKPDLIYFAGYVSDVSTVLKHLATCDGQATCLLVMGGDGLYVQGDYSLVDFKNYDRLLFTAFAFQAQEQASHPQFFKNYARYYDPNGLYRPGTYGYTSTDADIILSYDATQVLLQASQQLQAQGTSHLTPQAIQQTLRHIYVDGVSGPISFDQNGNPVHKGVVILKGSTNGKTILVRMGQD